MYIKTNGIPTTLQHAIDYDLPIDDAEKVLKETYVNPEETNDELDNLTDKVSELESKLDVLDEWSCIADKTIDVEISEIFTKIADKDSNMYDSDGNPDSVWFYGEMVSFVEKIMGELKKEIEY